MKTILSCLVIIGVAFFLLRSDLTPWRILSRSEIEDMMNARLSAQRSRFPQPAPHPTISNGEWMRDPNYRTSLERTTVVGRPEGAAPRDAPYRQATPKPH